MLILSQSGETEEIVRLLPSLAEFGVPIVAITGRAESTLGRAAAVTIELGPLEEACALGLAPSTSTTAMLAVGDALALVVSQMRRFSREDFARFHPAGSLGYKLSKVEQHARPLEQCRVAERRADRPRGAGRHEPAGPADRGDDAGRRARAGCPASSPTAIWPGCSSIAATAIWIGPSAR